MKKLALTALAMLSCGIVSALPVGNPTEASLYKNGFWCGRSATDPCDPCFSWCDAFSLRVGFYGDYVFNRNMEINGNNNDRDINQFSLNTNAGYLALNICDWMDVFSSLGATTISAFGDAVGFSAAGTNSVRGALNLEWFPAFSWSIGARATLWECDCWGIGLEGQYFRTKTNLNYVLDNLVGDFKYFNANNSATYSEWQVGLGASYTFTLARPDTAFVPYMGIKWAGSKLTHDLSKFTTEGPKTVTITDLQSKKLWGYCVGVTATQNETFGVTVEGRFADERAVYVNGQMRF
jgi:major outer membrane protein